MGRARRDRTRRQLRRLLTGARRLDAQEAKPPCATCAFSDPEAWIADLRMAEKVLGCLREPHRHRFFCHEGLKTGGEYGTTYQVPRTPDGRPDAAQLTRCGGFLRWAVPWYDRPRHEQVAEVDRLQHHYLTRFLASTHEMAVEWRRQGFTARLVQQALRLTGRAPCSAREDGY